MRLKSEKSKFRGALLNEASHRHANEFAAAIAALRLVKVRLNRPEPMIEDAIERLENSVRLERLLLNPDEEGTSPLVHKLAMLICMARINDAPLNVRTLGNGLIQNTDDARLFLRVAYEMIINAIKHHAAGEAPIHVLLINNDHNFRLIVANATVHHSPPRQVAPSGLLILRELATSVNGRIRWQQREDRFTTMATFPGSMPRNHPIHDPETSSHLKRRPIAGSDTGSVSDK